MFSVSGNQDGARYVVTDVVNHGSGISAHSEVIEKHYARTLADARKVMLAWDRAIRNISASFPGSSPHPVWSRESGHGDRVKRYLHTRLTRDRMILIHPVK